LGNPFLGPPSTAMMMDWSDPREKEARSFQTAYMGTRKLGAESKQTSRPAGSYNVHIYWKILSRTGIGRRFRQSRQKCFPLQLNEHFTTKAERSPFKSSLEWLADSALAVSPRRSGSGRNVCVLSFVFSASSQPTVNELVM
jgi:hypothetical protein